MVNGMLDNNGGYQTGHFIMMCVSRTETIEEETTATYPLIYVNISDCITRMKNQKIDYLLQGRNHNSIGLPH